MGGAAAGGGRGGQGRGLGEGRSGGVQGAPPLRLLQGAGMAAAAVMRSRREDWRVSTMILHYDDPDSLELLGVALGGAGAKVTAVPSAREALAAPGPFDVILSDIGMPEMDGYEFARRGLRDA